MPRIDDSDLLPQDTRLLDHLWSNYEMTKLKSKTNISLYRINHKTNLSTSSNIFAFFIGDRSFSLRHYDWSFTSQCQQHAYIIYKLSMQRNADKTVFLAFCCFTLWLRIEWWFYFLPRQKNYKANFRQKKKSFSGAWEL